MNLVKIGHAELGVRDLDEAAAFYIDVLGFVETAREADRLYLRGVSDTDHHSLILSRAEGPELIHFGWRVDRPEALRELERRFRREGRPIRWISAGEERGQGEALRVHDLCGHPVEFYYTMERVESLARKAHLWRGAVPQWLDHVALFTPDVDAGVKYYQTMGLHLSEYVDAENGDGMFAAWLHRTSSSHDIALVHKPQPGMQHVSFWVANALQVIHVADVVADAGWAACIEFGPGRHKATNSMFIYLRDPSGNRLEFYSEGYWIPDMDAPPIHWTFEDYKREGRLSWGERAPASFFEPIPVRSWA